MVMGTYGFGTVDLFDRRYRQYSRSLYLEQKWVRCGYFVGNNVKIPFFNNHFAIIAAVAESGNHRGIQYIKLLSDQFSNFFREKQIIEIPQMASPKGIPYKFQIRNIAGNSICLLIQ